MGTISGDDDLLFIVRGLHAGAVCDVQWHAALDRVSDRFAGSALTFGAEGDSPAERGFTGHRIEEECVALIGGPLATPVDNPFLAAMPLMPIGRSIPTARACGDRALLDSRLYREALQPFGQRYVLGGMLERVGGRARVVSLVRPARRGDYDAADAATLDRLMPHLATALHLRDQFARVRADKLLALEALADMGRGLIVANRKGDMLLANSEAERILGLHDGLQWRAGLTSPIRSVAEQLRQAAASSERRAVVVPRRSGHPPFTVVSLPAPAGLGAAVIFLIKDPQGPACPNAGLMRTLYGLTAAEAALATELVAGRELAEAAQGLGVRLNTAKTHLKSIFDKVGVHRQSALVRRLLIDLG